MPGRERENASADSVLVREEMEGEGVSGGRGVTRVAMEMILPPV